METYKDYSRFKASCSEFKDAFTEKYFTSGKLFCHPLCDGLIYAPCTPEEAKSNSVDICRMSDMLLMSDDGENFQPFKIAEARQIAEENGSVFITDLLFTCVFEAANWMIDGKHDTLIISEEHMKKEGKPYAPVTPLTNVIQHFKKFSNNFLYVKGTPENPAVLNSDDITKKLDSYLDELLSEFARLEIIGETEYELFGGKITTDKNESRCMELDKDLKLLDSLESAMSVNDAAFKIAGYKFEIGAFAVKMLVKAADKCGVTLTEKDFDGITEPEKLKDTFKKLVSDKNGYGFKYCAPDGKKAEEALHSAELSSSSAEELKKDIAALLTVRPACAAVFNLARAVSPADAENIENIAEYWNSSALTTAELGEYLDKAYVPTEARSSDGKLCCSGSEAAVIMEDINTAAAKYKLKNAPVLKELADYCEKFEKESRTYNGTVFDTVAEMEKAVKNEKELAELCCDLSALNEDELKKLRKYIYDMNLDKKTTGKYLLKIQLALNSCEENQLKMLCTGITLKKPEELAALKKKISEGGFDETLAAPYIAKISECIISADLKELTEMFKVIPDNTKADALEKALDSGKYDKIFKKHFAAKISDARDGFARSELGAICKNIGSADKKALDDISAKLAAVKCRAALKAPYEKEISARYAALEEQEVTSVFSGVKSADKAKITELREIIKSGKYKKSLTDKYISMLDERMAEIENEEFTKKCDTIPQMDKKALDEIIAALKSGKYPESISGKYLPMTAEREKAIIKAEVSEMCKDIASMDFAKLDELEKKLSDEKYPAEITSGFFDTIAARRKTLYKLEADALCKNIANMDKPALAELSEKLKNEKFDPEYTKKYFADIEARINKIETEKLTAMCKDIDKLKKPELEKLSADIAALGLRKENTAPFLEKIRKLEISLMKSEMENLCKNIANTPRKELSKLKEALSSGDFDKELSAKYIEQIDKRTAELIKNELSELCKNLANAPKDKLISMKLTIGETPEYAEAGKAYIEQIDSRLKQLDKAEFDKQMASIEKLNMEELEKFMDELDKRKPALDPKLYEASAAKCRERGEFLEKAELDKICAGIADADIAALNEMKEKVTEGSFTPEITYPYIKKIDDAVSDRHVKYFTKLTENINGMSRAELIVLLEKISKNENHCPDDMLQRYIGKVNSKIREADRMILDSKCKNLGSFTERRSFELIKDINDMDIDPADKKRYITQVELHITNVKTMERDEYIEKLKASMSENSIGGVHFYVPGVSKVFESQFVAICKAFASIEQFELPILIHEVTQGRTDDAYMLTVDYLYYKSKNGFGRVAVEQIERFEAKKGIFGASLHVVEKDGKSSELPNGIDKKALDNAVKVLNFILSVIQKDKSAAKLREAEEIKAAEEAKIKELEEERLEIEAARKKSENAEKAPEKKPEEKIEEKPAAEAPKKPETIAPEPIKPIKPIEVVVSPIPEVKPINPITPAAKPAEAPKPVQSAPAAKPAEAPKPVQSAPAAKPAEAPKSAESAPAAKPAEAPKPAETAPAAKPAEAPKPVMRMKFCDQCGAKIISETAKFCAECGNKLIK